MWLVTKDDKEKLLTIEKKKILRRIYGSNMENREYKMRTNIGVYRLYLKPNIKSFISGKHLERSGRVWSSNDEVKKKKNKDRHNQWKKPRGLG